MSPLYGVAAKTMLYFDGNRVCSHTILHFIYMLGERRGVLHDQLRIDWAHKVRISDKLHVMECRQRKMGSLRLTPPTQILVSQHPENVVRRFAEQDNTTLTVETLLVPGRACHDGRFDNETILTQISMLNEFTTNPVLVHDKVTAAVFANEIAPFDRPVLMRGLVTHWPAVRAGRESPHAMAAYIVHQDSGLLTTILEAPATIRGRFAYGADMDEFNFNRRNRSLSAGVEQLIDLLDRADPSYVYIQSVPVSQFLPNFGLENVNPVLPATINGRIWISNATRAQTHNDNAHNIACVVSGRRRFTLFPPDQVKNLYIGPMDHTPSGRAISMASLEEPDFQRFPRLREAIAQAQIAEMEPGDALYIPMYWWHHVQSLAKFNVLVNYWWGMVPPKEHGLTAFQAALLMLKDVPEGERKYWKAMFDHYIFQTDGDPNDHIPEKHQGPLGKLTPELRTQIRRRLQQILSTG